MTQKPLNRITVAEIMRGCGMARQHFYYHFDDVYDAVRWIFEEEAVALLREHEGVMLWQDGLLQLFQYLQENRVFCPLRPSLHGPGPPEAVLPDGYPRHHPEHDPSDCRGAGV